MVHISCIICPCDLPDMYTGPDGLQAWAYISGKSLGTMIQPLHIKTHGSVSCGSRSRRVTPVSILTGRKKTQFSHLRSSVLPLRNTTIFAVETPSTFSTPHSKLERNRFKRSRDIRLQNWLSFFVFFLIFLPLFAHLQKLL